MELKEDHIEWLRRLFKQLPEDFGTAEIIVKNGAFVKGYVHLPFEPQPKTKASKK